jgi:hypothetical protein
VRARVRQESKDWQVLQERPGPPVGEQQRQRARTATFNVNHVQCATPDFRTLLTQSVEPALKGVGVKHTPILQKSVQPIGRDASVPARSEVHGPSMAVEPAAKFEQRVRGQLMALLNDSQAAVIVHAAHPDTAHRAAAAADAKRRSNDPARCGGHRSTTINAGARIHKKVPPS